MKYNKIVSDGYILSITTSDGKGHGNISESEYNEIREIIRNRPTAPEGYGYRLTGSLVWELYEIPPVEVEEDPELTDSEALEIIVNGGNNNA